MMLMRMKGKQNAGLESRSRNAAMFRQDPLQMTLTWPVVIIDRSKRFVSH